MSSKFKTLFNKDWLMDKSFSSWIEASISPHQARCKLCCKTFELSNMGRQAVKSHEMSATHIRNSSGSSAQSPLAQYLQPKNSGVHDQHIVETVHFQDEPDHAVSISEAVQSPVVIPDKFHQSVSHAYNDSVTKAEVLWALQSVAKHQSYRSCYNTK